MTSCPTSAEKQRWLWAAALMLLALTACGGGGDDGGASGGGTYVSVYIDAPAADAVLAVSTADFSGGAACPDCPPTDWAFGYCPSGTPFIPGTAVTVSWANRTTGASGTAFQGISGSCSCLFSYCAYSYSRRWTASVPLANGVNAVEIVAADASGGSGSASRTVTRVPPAPFGVTTAVGAGQVAIAWDSVQGATSYNVYWSTSRALSKADGTKITNVSSPYAHTGLTDDVTYYYLVTAENSGFESAASAVVWGTVGWTTEPVASTTSATLQRDASIAVDTAGNPHLHYSFDEHVGASSLQYNDYASRAAGVWTTVHVDNPKAVYAGVALDQGDAAHLIYLDFAGLTHAIYASGAWTAEVVDLAAWCDASLAIDSAGHAHVAYAASTTTSSELRYATNASGSWVTSAVGTYASGGCDLAGRRVSIAVDPGGSAHIAYAGDYPDYGVKYAAKQGGAWVVSTIDPGYVQQLSAAADANGKVHVAFADNAGRLRYANNLQGAWNVSDIESQGSPMYPSLALDAAGYAHVSYFHLSYGELRYAKNTSGAWQMTTVADSGTAIPNSGTDTAIALDALGKVHIGYFDNRTGGLRYATNKP
jgi:hypothetical protein